MTLSTDTILRRSVGGQFNLGFALDHFPIEGLNFPVCLAPMVGLSHVGLRLLLREYLPVGASTFWPTEMLNSRRLPNERLGSTAETKRAMNENDLVPQILGNEEGPIRASVEKLQDWGVLGIDINMGCPVKKALQHNYGVALMGDMDYAARVVEMTAQYSRVPVSVKLRAGLNDNVENLVPFVTRLQDAGAKWITLHPRFAHENRRGDADWTRIREIKESLQIPVIGNGDVQVADDVVRLFEHSRCDLVMIGRALTARPWLLWQLGERMGFRPPKFRCEKGFAPHLPEEEGAEYGRALLRYLEIMSEFYEGEELLKKVRFFVKTGSVWLEFGHTLYADFTRAKSIPEMLAATQKFFAVPQRMMSKTALRG